MVDTLDAKEYGEFLKKRAIVNQEQREEIEAKREAKLLRILAADAKEAKAEAKK